VQKNLTDFKLGQKYEFLKNITHTKFGLVIDTTPNVIRNGVQDSQYSSLAVFVLLINFQNNRSGMQVEKS